MKTLSERVCEKASLQTRIKAAEMIQVAKEGLFGIYHYKIDNTEFEQIAIGAGYRAKKYWVIRCNGKEARIPYKYVLYLTLKKLSLI